MSDGDGHILAGRYELGWLLGRGGFGEVYLARQLSTGQAVAVKLIRHDALALSPAPGLLRERFRRETQVVAALSHQHVVGLVDAGECDQQLYAVYEYIDGQTLRVVLDEGPLSLDRTITLMSQVAQALAVAHAQGVVHRDLKPANIMVIGARGPLIALHAKVLDFGLAALRGEARDALGEQSLTSGDAMPGTPAYMAPEQFVDRSEVGPWSDVYAWGLIFVECVSGRPVVEGGNPWTMMAAHVSATAHGLPDGVDDASALGVVLHRAMAKDPMLRYVSAHDLLEDLFGLIGAESRPVHVAQTPVDPVSIESDVLRAVDAKLAQMRGAWSALPRRRRAVVVAVVVALVITVLVLVLDDRDLALIEHSPPVLEARRLDDGDVIERRPSSLDAFGPDVVDGDVVQLGDTVTDAAVVEDATLAPVIEASPPDPGPDCDPGQIVDDGHCCWPGQRWRAQWETCVGEPECPREHLRSGQDCEPVNGWLWDQHVRCFGGEPDHCVQVAHRLMSPGATPYLPQVAADHFGRACDLGHVSACLSEAGMYQAGAQVPVDRRRSLRRYEQACRVHGSGLGCHMAAVQHQAGLGVMANAEKANELYLRACKGGFDAACEQLARTLLAAGSAEAARPLLDRCQGSSTWCRDRLRDIEGDE